MLRLLRWLFVRASCEFCGALCPSDDLQAGACPTCVAHIQLWADRMGGVVTMPQGWRWPV